MLYANGSLTVPRAGSYFVFSQVQLYHVACGRVRESAHVEVVHSVRVTTATTTTAATTADTTAGSGSGGGAATVMSTTWVPCASAASARPTWFQSSHLGGVFHLQAGSSVAVHVTHGDVVADKREWNFFGAFLL
ncbi:tumor necrosis factor ligand superfamily member 14-like [Petromyzon marinus]|uniref:tumor necrosis factor ligand superfamily member 14-like n=1 Tax=Petromyzon marinus TaxID=7757 RepID=UPI003F705661